MKSVSHYHASGARRNPKGARGRRLEFRVYAVQANMVVMAA
jgi:hypothetical protein